MSQLNGPIERYAKLKHHTRRVLQDGGPRNRIGFQMLSTSNQQLCLNSVQLFLALEYYDLDFESIRRNLGIFPVCHPPKNKLLACNVATAPVLQGLKQSEDEQKEEKKSFALCPFLHSSHRIPPISVKERVWSHQNSISSVSPETISLCIFNSSK